MAKSACLIGNRFALAILALATSLAAIASPLQLSYGGGPTTCTTFGGNQYTVKHQHVDHQKYTVSTPNDGLVYTNPDDPVYLAAPTAGFLTAMRQCAGQYEWLLTIPCVSPLFPLDLLLRLGKALVAEKSEIAMAMAPEAQADGSTLLRPQPVFCLMRTDLADDLQAFVDGGGRKIGAWTASHKQIKLGFNAPVDDARAFANTNTLDELHAVEKP